MRQRGDAGSEKHSKGIKMAAAPRVHVRFCFREAGEQRWKVWEESDERILGRPSAGVDVPLKDKVFLTLPVVTKEPNSPPHVEVRAHRERVHRHGPRDGGLRVGSWEGGKTCNTHERASPDTSQRTEASTLAC